MNESKDFIGYYDIDGYSNYAVSKDGQVLNKKKGELLSGSTNPDGYHNFRLTGDDGYTLTWGRHRLLGFVFKNPGKSITDLVINHKNGIKGDDRLDNLEWVSYQGNAEHAGENGLTEKCIPVSVRDVDSGEVLHFPSFIECARAFDLSKDAIAYRVRIGQVRVFPERKQYRRKTDIDWYIPVDIEKSLLMNSTSKSVLLKCLRTGKITQFDKLSDLADHLHIAPSTLTQWISIPDQPVLPGLIQLKWAHDLNSWREIEDPYIELAKSTGKKPVAIINDSTNDVTVFEAPIDCASVMFLKPTNLNHRLKSKGAKVFSDGYRYCYYSDLKNLRSQ